MTQEQTKLELNRLEKIAVGVAYLTMIAGAVTYIIGFANKNAPMVYTGMGLGAVGVGSTLWVNKSYILRRREMKE